MTGLHFDIPMSPLMFYSGFYFGIHIQDGSKSESTLSRHVHKVHLIVRENAGEETKWSKKTKLVS